MARLDVIARLAETDGVLAVDKPAGIAAHDALKSVRRQFNLVKLGHGGTLEPTASGIFVMLLGDANRLAPRFMGADSTYVGTLALGRVTDTADAAGNPVAERDFSGVSRERLEAALAGFRGDVYQSEPEFSAVKRYDSAAYEVVRTVAEGEAPAERLVHAYRLAVTEFAPPAVGFEIACGKGFSVRAFARDLGDALGCGASLTQLRRVKCGRLSLADAIPFHDLMRMDGSDLPDRILPVSKAVGA